MESWCLLVTFEQNIEEHNEYDSWLFGKYVS